MQETFELDAEVRADLGKGASRRLRRANKVPAVLYGGHEDPVSLTLVHSELVKHLEHEAFYSHLLRVKFDGKTEQAVLRDVQRHPSKPVIMHIDLMRVSAKEKLRMAVPLHFINEETAIGVKQQGGIIAHLMTEVEVSCLPKDLPEHIVVDVADLKAGESIHLSNLALPADVELVELSHGAEHDQAVVSIHMPRGAAAEEGGEEAGEEGEAES
jgi:large subunit ribosomal protein L25